MAEKELQEVKYLAASKKAKRLKSFYKSLMAFIVLNLLIMISLFVPAVNDSNFFWLLIIWGLFLLYQGLNYFSNFWIFSDSWEERQIKKTLKKPRLKKKLKTKSKPKQN